ncbi:MAG: hypothetical protein WAU04_03420, partial [Candidatus Nitrotoga sp.]
MAGSPSQFGRYERDNKPAMHVLFWSRQYSPTLLKCNGVLWGDLRVELAFLHNHAFSVIIDPTSCSLKFSCC